MAGEEAELVGGISVSLGASHASLPGDIAAANRIVEEQWSNRVFTAKLGVEAAGVQGGAGRALAAVPPPRSVFGAAATTGATAQQGQTALQRRIDEELAKTGERYNPQTGEIEKTAAATTAAVSAPTGPRQTAAVAIVRPSPDAEKLTGALAEEREGLTGLSKSIGQLAEKQEAQSVSVATGGEAQGAPARVETQRAGAEVADLHKIVTSVVAVLRSNPSLLASLKPRIEAQSQTHAAEAERATAIIAPPALGRATFTLEQQAQIQRGGLPSVTLAPRQATEAVEVERARTATPEATALQVRAQTVSVETPSAPVTAAREAAGGIGAPVVAAIPQIEAQRTQPVEQAPVNVVPQVVTPAAVEAVPRTVAPAESTRAVPLGPIASRAVAFAQGGGGGNPPRPTATGAPEEGEPEGGLTGITRRAVFAMREEERAGANIQAIRARSGRQAYNESEKQRRQELVSTASFYDKAAALTEKHFTGEAERLGGAAAGPIQYVDRLEPARRQARESRGQSPIEVNRSEQALNRQRQQEEARAARQIGQQNVGLLAPEGIERLGNLTYEAEHEGGPAPTSTTFAPNDRAAKARRAEELAAREIQGGQAPVAARTQAEREELSRRLAASNQAQAQAGATASQGANAEAERARELQDREIDTAAQKTALRGRTPTEDQRERAIQANVERQRVGITASARTGRTASFGLGTLLGGTKGEAIEATTRQAAAARDLTRAEQDAAPIRRRIAEYDEDIANTSGKVREGYVRRRQAFISNEGNAAIIKREVDATKSLAAADAALGKLQGFRSISQNLLAGAAGGAAFGIAMSAISGGLGLVEKAVGPTLERLTGFATATAKYTSDLSDATRAASGNAQAVVALKLANTGLSASAAATIQPLIQQRTEIEAGNKALQDQIEAFNVSENLRKQGATAGLGSTTGGFLGTGLLGIPSTGEQIGNLLRQRGNEARSPLAGVSGVSPFSAALPGRGGAGAAPASSQASTEAAASFGRALADVNDSLVKGGDAGVQFTQGAKADAAQIEQTARAFDALSPAMAAAIRENQLYSASLTDEAAAKKALSAINYAAQLPDPALLAQQFARQNKYTLDTANRQQQFAVQTQIPAQRALQNLVQPLQPVGVSYAARPGELSKSQQADVAKTRELQSQLNAEYARGAQILQNDYHIPPQLITDLRAVGVAIAGLQAGLIKEQAVFQVHQYDENLRVARQTLQDINGLTGRNFGGVGQSVLGDLGKQNLALSRQGQLLQFNLSQRQINFQVASAGFLAPGVSSEERTQRITEAKYEASIAQKGLNIQEKIFGNQVQIVDIENLRQGVTLAKQIGLLLEGRKGTIDVQVKTEEIDRLVAQQQAQLAVIQTYISKGDALANAAISQIGQVEAAADKFLGKFSGSVLSSLSQFLTGVTDIFNSASGQNAPPPTQRDYNHPTTPPSQPPPPARDRNHASGAVGRTSGTMDMTIGEAGGEEYAILAHPRAYMGAMGGGGSTTINFNGGITVRSDSDIDTIVRKVERALNNRAGLIMRTG